VSRAAAALLRRQFRQAHELLEAAVARPHDAAAAGAPYARAVLCEDIAVNGVLAARSPLALSTWAGRTGLDPLPRLGAPIDWAAWARAVRLDLDGVRAYAHAVHDATDGYLATLPDPADATTVRILTGLLLMVSARSGEIAGLERRLWAPAAVSIGGAPGAHSPNSEEPTMTNQAIVTREEWLAARKALLDREKAATRARDELSAERRRLPMVEVGKDYVFEGPSGRVGLLDLFEGRRQLIVYHFMFAPEWDEGCNACSVVADNVGHLAHLHARDTSFALVSRAPLSKIEPFKARMGWTLPWYSSFGTDFNYDYHATQDEASAPVEYNYRNKAELIEAGLPYMVSGETPALSVFLRDGARVFHTYSAYARGLEALLGTYSALDLTPLGRNEDANGIISFLYHDGQAPLPDHRRPV
jgi:predicted dithiol-disulfide oxidoreductase (DUF899 family)